MNIRNLTWICLSLLTCTAAAQGPYQLAAVPEAVKNKAAVVVHLNETQLTVTDIDKSSVNFHKVYTVLNDEGRDYLYFRASSSKYATLGDVEIKVYDANGKQTEKYKKKDLRTYADGEGLIEDGFVNYIPFTASKYPVTVDLKFEVNLKGTLFFPDFHPIAPKEGVVEARYTAKVLSEVGLRYKNKYTSIEPTITEDGKYKIYTWSAKNLSAAEAEDGAAEAGSKHPYVMLSPARFSYFGLKGDLSSWENFGAWLKDMYNGLDELPAERQQFFRQLTKDAGGQDEVIRRIYKYIQENFRYVSIQLGIGGLKPFPADFTDKKKYGDCKALSNYMKAALKSVGIRSHVAIINAGYNQEPVDADFPANSFNHVILCIPGSKDSTWLECTSSTAEFGELGTFTENRNALLVTEQGGALVPTPRSRASANRLSTVSRVEVREDQSAMIETFFMAKGGYKVLVEDILKEKRDEQKKSIVSYFGARQPDDFQFAKTELPEKTQLKMLFSKLQDFNAGNKLFVTPRVYKIWPYKLPKAENRTSDFYFQYPFEKYDTTIFKLPASITTDVLPGAKEWSCEYASYRSNYWYDDKEHAVYSATSLILKSHKIPAAEYAAVKKFFDSLTQDETQKLVVIRSEAAKKAF